MREWMIIVLHYKKWEGKLKSYLPIIRTFAIADLKKSWKIGQLF